MGNKIKKIFFNEKKLILIIFFLALFLRTWDLSVFPEAIDEDEMALGYYGYSLIKNGTDEYGNKFPLYFESVGDYKYGLYSYFAAIPISIFGLTPFSSRLISALSGSLSVIAFYYLIKELSSKKAIPYICAIVLALNPIHIHFSRLAYNNILGAFFSILCLLFFVRWIKEKNLKNIIFIFIFFLLSVYSYQAYRIFLPAVIGFSVLFLFFNGGLNKVKKAILLTVTLLLLTFVSFIPVTSRARSQSITTLFNMSKMTEYFAEDSMASTPLPITRIFHNKPISFTQGIFSRYISYFNPSFLFSEISQFSERHSVPDIGLLYLIEAPFLFLGLLFFVKEFGKEFSFIPVAMLITAPLAAALVLGPQSITRAIVLIYPLTIFVALGIYLVLKYFKYNFLLILLITFLYLGNLSFFVHQYFVHKTYHHPWYTDYGLKEMVEVVNKNYNKYDNIVVSRGHYIPFLFYNKVDPKDFISKSSFREKYEGGVKVSSFGKIIFNMPYDCPSAGKVNTLYVCFGYKVPKDSELVDYIRYRDNQPAIFFIKFPDSKVTDNKNNLPERFETDTIEDLRFKNGIIPPDYDSFWPENHG